MARLEVTPEIIADTLALEKAMEEMNAGRKEQHTRYPKPKHNSDVAIAHAWLEGFTAYWEAVSTQGKLWYYDTEQGIWDSLDKDHLIHDIAHYDGLTMGKGKIRLDKSHLSGICELILTNPDIRDDTFFSSAPAGIICGGKFVSVNPGKIEVQEATSDHRARFCVDFEYDERIDTTQWADFVKTLFDADDDADDKAALLQEFFGACLIGKAHQYGKALILTGSGANGKSTFIDLMMELFPPYGHTSIPPQQWASDYHLAGLRESILNSCNEIPATEIGASDRFKSVVTGEPLTARLPYGKPFSFVPTAGHVFACNELPYVRDHSDGFWRRFLTVTFNRDFRKEGRTKEDVLSELRPMLPSVLKWTLVGGARILETGKYTLPASHAEELDAWQRESNSVRMWLDNVPFKYCTEGIKASALYQVYKHWARIHGYKPFSLSIFGKRITSLGVRKKRKQSGNYYLIAPIHTKDYEGLRLFGEKER